MKRTCPLFILACALTLLAALALAVNAWAGPGDPNDPNSPNRSGMAATPVVITDRLAAPVLPPHPSQADLGAQVYYQVCMACHGDKGQGLTDEWRAVWGEDSFCWNRECHGSNPPPQGFSFPRTCCKAVIGPGTLVTYKNGQELFNYIVTTMPWWNPGYLKREEYWELTAFLLRAHNALPAGVTVDEHNAYVFKLHPTAPLPGDLRPQVSL